MTDKLKILGIYFGTANVEEANWDSRKTKLENRLNMWKTRTLSLRGKSLIINTLGASGLWFMATVVNMPAWVHTRGLLVGRKNRTSQERNLPSSTRPGRFNIVDPLEKSFALKLRWVPCVGDPSSHTKWLFFARYWIGFHLSRLMKNWASLLRANNAPKHLGDPHDKPQVYQTIQSAVNCIRLDFDLLTDRSVEAFYSKLISPPKGRLRCTLGNKRFQSFR